MRDEISVQEMPKEAQTSRAPRPTSSSRKSEKRREEIMIAATKVMNARTYALATMTEIAAALDLRDASLYYYFKSKQALAYACHCRSLDRFEGFLLAADRNGADGASKLEQFLLNLLQDSHQHGPLLYFGDYFHLEAKQRRAIATRAARLSAMLEQFLKTGIGDGSIAPCETELVVNLLLGMLIWLAKWVDTVENITVERLMAAIDTFSMRGLAVRGGEGAADRRSQSVASKTPRHTMRAITAEG